METGWIKLHRQILDNIFLMHDNNAFLVLTKLLMMVNKQTGQYACGRNQLGETLNINPRTLYGVLIRLENQGILSLESNTRYSIISIKNWQKYQASTNRGENRIATASSTAKQQGSNDASSTGTSTTAQQRDNNGATTAQHSNKNKEVRIKNKNSTNVLGAEIAPVPKTPKVPSVDIEDLLSYWHQVVGYEIKRTNKKNRFACSNLIRAHGVGKVKQLVDGVALAQADRYGPNIADFSGLQFKLNDLMAWGKKQRANGVKGGSYKI